MRIPTTSLRTGLGMTGLVSRRAVFDILRGRNRRGGLNKLRHCEERSDVAIRFSLELCVVLVRCEGMRIPTTRLRCKFALAKSKIWMLT